MTEPPTILDSKWESERTVAYRSLDRPPRTKVRDEAAQASRLARLKSRIVALASNEGIAKLSSTLSLAVLGFAVAAFLAVRARETSRAVLAALAEVERACQTPSPHTEGTERSPPIRPAAGPGGGPLVSIDLPEEERDLAKLLAERRYPEALSALKALRRAPHLEQVYPDLVTAIEWKARCVDDASNVRRCD